MKELLELKLELETVRRAYWQSQQQLSQLLIERSLAIENALRAQLAQEQAASASTTETTSASGAAIRNAA